MKYALLLLLSLTLIHCSPKNELNLNGSYSARMANVDSEFSAVAASSMIQFIFHNDGKVDYTVSAMGQNNQDQGSWFIEGDTLHIVDLNRGPDSAFKIEQLSETEFKISGPNTFILTKTD